jgi:protein subunit release factor A
LETTVVSNEENIMRIEIRAAEGGQDSKLFVSDLAQVYQRYLSAKG